MSLRILLVVDAQNDFCQGGALAVPEGEAIIPVVNELLASREYDVRVATQDWHPANHGSFASQNPDKELFSTFSLNGVPQTLWPDHCVQNSPGAEFHPDLALDKLDAVFQKGTDARVDSYSGFYDNAKASETGLREYIQNIAAQHGITDLSEVQVDVCGLAMDYCVGFTALDAKEIGLDVNLIYDATRAISPDSEREMLQKLHEQGINVIESREVLSSRGRDVEQTRVRGQELNP